MTEETTVIPNQDTDHRQLRLDQALKKVGKLTPEEVELQRVDRKNIVEQNITTFRNQITDIDSKIADFNKMNRKNRRRNKKWLVEANKVRKQVLQNISIMNQVLGQLQDVS